MTIQQAIGKIEKLESSIKSIGSSVLLKSMKRLEREYKERVFVKGISSNGAKIGNYSEGWAEVRQSKGLQTAFIDLKFTGSLYKSIKTAPIDESSVVMYVDDDLNYEKKYGSWETALTVSNEEVNDLFVYFEFYFNQEIDKKLA